MNKLQQAVIEQLGYDELTEDCKVDLENVCEHGAAVGFSGFIYYNDTIQFFDDNKELIIDELRECADQMGEDPLVMVSNFNSIKGDFSTFEISSAIYEEDNENETTIKNLLSWFALEEVARQLVDY